MSDPSPPGEDRPAEPSAPGADPLPQTVPPAPAGFAGAYVSPSAVVPGSLGPTPAGPGDRSRPPAAPRRSPVGPILLVIALVVAIAGGVAFVLRDDADDDREPTAAPTSSIATLPEASAPPSTMIDPTTATTTGTPDAEPELTSDGDADAAAAVVQAWFDAVLAGDYAAACDLMAAQGRERLAASASSCAAGLEATIGPSYAGITAVTVDDVTIDRAIASMTATLEGSPFPATPQTATYEDGRWWYSSLGSETGERQREADREAEQGDGG